MLAIIETYLKDTSPESFEELVEDDSFKQELIDRLIFSEDDNELI